MPPLQEKALLPRELIDIHPEMPGKTSGISFFKVDETRLAAARAATLTLEGVHERKG
jgi:hypothetical protein